MSDSDADDARRYRALRTEVRAFAALMERTLRANDHKGGWEECKADWLLTRLREETSELQSALDERRFDCAQGGRSASPEETPLFRRDVASEAADVANFAMMIADVCGELCGAEESLDDLGAGEHEGPA